MPCTSGWTGRFGTISTRSAESLALPTLPGLPTLPTARSLSRSARRSRILPTVPMLAILAVLAILAMKLSPDAAAATLRVTIRTDDGVALAATWYEPSSRPGPAVILVHMLTHTRREWEAFAQRLSSEGIGALAIDLRGHGEPGRTAVADDVPA